MTYTVESAGYIFKKGRGYFNTKQVPAWKVVRSDGKESQTTSIREEAEQWCEHLNAGFRPTGIYI